MDTTNKFTHLSLCSGYDGIGLGLEGAGFDIGLTVHVEVEAFASYNLVKKIEAGALGEGVVWPDLKSFPYERFRGCFDILSGGFPCQPFSQAGKGGGDEDPRHLFPFILKGIRECLPDMVVLENVEGIVSAKLKGDHWNDPAGTPVLLHVLRELERVGYRATAVPTSASEVGAPHQRNRWFIIGVLADGESERLERYTGVLAGCLESGREPSLPSGSSCGRGSSRTIWPSPPGQEQFGWEPPKVVGYAKNVNGERPAHRHREQQAGGADPDRAPDHKETKSQMGGNADGPSGGMGYAELQRSCDNRTDELRLLGNGVVPASCTSAVLRGLSELAHTRCI